MKYKVNYNNTQINIHQELFKINESFDKNLKSMNHVISLCLGRRKRGVGRVRRRRTTKNNGINGKNL